MFVDRTEVINPYRVKVYLKKPYPEIEERVGDYMLIMPKRYYEKVGKKGFEWDFQKVRGYVAGRVEDRIFRLRWADFRNRQ